MVLPVAVWIIGAAIAGFFTTTVAMNMNTQAKAEATSTVLKGAGEAKALEKGTSSASSTDLGFGLFKTEQAFESGKERSSVMASTKQGGAAVASNQPTGIDTSTGATGTNILSKNTEGGIGALSGFNIGSMFPILIYGSIIIIIFMVIRK